MYEPTRFVNKKRLTTENLRTHEATYGKDLKQERCKSVDLDEIFQFSAARQRALERNAQVEYEQPFKNFVQNRVFINHVDSFNGRILVDYLSEQTIDIVKHESISDDDELEYSISGEESEEIPGEKEPKKEEVTTKQNFEIIGTVDFMKNPEYTRPESVHEILDEEKKDEFLTKLFTCGFIIYDITSTLNCHPIQIEEATWILNSILSQLEDLEKHAPKLFKKYKDCRTFILISTLMTWVKTKPIDPDDPRLPFTERDYRKRKPHPNYKIHCEFEKKVLEIGKRFPDNLRTIVIGSGVTYGHEEDVLHFLFKMAWLNGATLPIFKPGTNKIPLIHVNALANIVHLLLIDFPTSIKYIIAVEESPTSLKKIVKLISRKLGNGKYVKVNKEEAFTYPDVKQRNYDMLTVNLNIIPGYIVNNMELKYSAEQTFRENIDAVIAEFRDGRKLKPIKIFIHGPPASGKTFLSRRLANYYQIHHLHVKGIIEDSIQDIRDRIEQFKSKEQEGTKEDENASIELENAGDNLLNDYDNGDDDDDDDDDDEEESLETLTQMLNEIEENLANNDNRLDEQFVLRLFKRRMLSNPCQNQGYVIDGYPKTMEDTKILYEPDEEIEDIDDEDENADFDVSRFYNKKIMPDYVESLDAADEFLIQRVIKMPQSVVENSHYVEEEMCRRLVQFRLLNTEDNTPLIFYDELDIYPTIHSVENENDVEMDLVFEDIVNKIGPPRNYGAAFQAKGISSGGKKNYRQYVEDIKSKSHKMIQERREKMENWMFLKNQEKEMEEKALAVLAMPLRHYLMKYIFPTLTRGLVEVARVRPQDPVDYLAEYLFKENPEGKMFQPNYETLEDELTEAMRDYEGSLGGQEPDSQELTRRSHQLDDSAIIDAVSNITDVKAQCSNPSLPSKRTEDGAKDSDKDESSSGSCKCPPVPSRRSSSSTSSTSTPPLPPSVCTCPPYSRSQYYSSSTTSSTESEKACSQDPVAACRCGL